MSRPFLPPDIDQWMENAAKAVFLLDFDGTMVHFAPHPDDVIVPPELVANLKLISLNKEICFAIVTGRTLHVLDRLLGGLTTVAVGSHGAEWRPRPGADIEILAEPIPPCIRQAMSAVAIAHNCIFEDKIYTVSMHLPPDALHIDLTPELIAATGGYASDYMVRRILGTFEVLQNNINKGTGIRQLMQQPAFAGKWPVYIGDDADTDASLAAVKEFKGLCLGVSPHTPEEEAPLDRMGIESVRWILQLLAQL